MPLTPRMSEAIHQTDYTGFLPAGRARSISRSAWKAALDPKLNQAAWETVEAEAKAYRRQLAKEYLERQQRIAKQQDFQRVHRYNPSVQGMLNGWLTRFNRIR